MASARVRTSIYNGLKQLRFPGQPDVIEDVPSKAIRPTLKVVSSPYAPGDVQIERLILHPLDNRRESLELVDEPVTLTPKSEAFFAEHICTADGRAEWDAVFDNPNGDVANWCRELLAKEEERFVEASQKLARRLYTQMRERPHNISPGDFVVIVYTIGQDTTHHIALLKLDLDKRWARTFKTISGRRHVDILEADNLFAETRRLQKCAILTPYEPGQKDFHITLLDTQAGPKAAEGIANFFYKRFLDAELLPTARRQTREFLRSTTKWMVDNGPSLDPAAVETFYDARRSSLKADKLDIAGFLVAALPNHAEMRDDLSDHLIGAISGARESTAEHFEEISIDRVVAQPVVDFKTIELDHGALLIVPANHFHEFVNVAPERTVDNKVRIVIDTSIFNEVIDRRRLGSELPSGN